MPAEKALALVLRTVEFSETSLVVTLFTREFGKLSGLAKGARRLKGPFESALDLLAVCRIVFLPKSSDALDLLTEAKLVSRFRPAGRELAGLYAGYYVAELLLEMTDAGDPHPELFDAAVATLEALHAGGTVAALVLRFEMNTLRLLGHLPAFDWCVECGAPAPASGRVSFGLVAGGVLCSNCRAGKRHVVSVSAPVMQTLKTFADPNSNTWLNAPEDYRITGELRAVVNHYLSHLLGRKPRLHEFLGTIVAPSAR